MLLLLRENEAEGLGGGNCVRQNGYIPTINGLRALISGS